MRIIYKHRTRGQDVEQVHIEGVSNGFRAEGYEVVYCSPPSVATDKPTSTASKSMWNLIAGKSPLIVYELLSVVYNFVAVRKLLRMLRTTDCHFVYERYAFFDASSYFVSRLKQFDLVLEVNGAVNRKDPTHARPLKLKWLAAYLERMLFHRAKRIVVVSTSLKLSLTEMGISEGKIIVLPNAVDLCTFDFRLSGKEIRDAYGIGSKTVVGFLGSFTFWHRVGFMIESLAQVLRDEPTVQLLLIGDGEDRRPVELLTKRLGLEPSVTFTGKIPHAKVAPAVAAMDIGVMPHSNDFGSPMKIFEYMAMKKAVVAARFRPIAEVIEHERNGLLFTPGHCDEFAACVGRLIHDSGLRSRLGSQGRLDVEAKHTWGANSKTILESMEAK